MRETQAQLEERSRKAETDVLLLYESQIADPRLLPERDVAANARPIYMIIRPSTVGWQNYLPTKRRRWSLTTQS
jgi:hypothetical protein